MTTQIDREFNAVCLSVWGYTTDDFSDDLFSIADHAWLDTLDEAHARIFAAEQGYDLVDDNGMLTDWWGYCWMILAEKRGLLTPENRAAARAAIEEKYLAAPNVIGVIVGRLKSSASSGRRTAVEPRDVASAHRRVHGPARAFRRRGFGGLAAGHRSFGDRVSALTGATFISPSRARTSAVRPG